MAAGAERATFVLTNGQRVSGELTYKGGTVYTLDGRDYPADEVAVIDFAGGEPPASELRQLPTGAGKEHERDMFVMRDGQITRGKLYHIAADGTSIVIEGVHEVEPVLPRRRISAEAHQRGGDRNIGEGHEIAQQLRRGHRRAR